MVSCIFGVTTFTVGFTIGLFTTVTIGRGVIPRFLGGSCGGLFVFAVMLLLIP